MKNIRAFQYLEKYGYVNDEQQGSLFNPDRGLVGHMKEALLEFQAYAGINQTGVLDKDTAQIMEMPRCGVRDIIRIGKISDMSNRLYYFFMFFEAFRII